MKMDTFFAFASAIALWEVSKLSHFPVKTEQD